VAVEALRPRGWVLATGAAARSRIRLDLPELSLSGEAEMLSIEECPLLEEGKGRLVTARIMREGQSLLALHFEGFEEPLLATASHLFFSPEGLEYVRADALEQGDLLLLANGKQVIVEKAEEMPGLHRVFNLEVEGEQRYYASEAQVLVYNMVGRSLLRGVGSKVKDAAKAPKVSTLPKAVNLNSNRAISRFGIYEIKPHGALHKIGKADMNRITQASGQPTRLHQQVTKLIKVHGKRAVIGSLIDDLGNVTTASAKIAENARLQLIFKQSGAVPPGNRKSFKP